LFGATTYRAEIIWVPGNGSKARKGPGTTHQTILVFSKSKDFVWNAGDPALREPYADTSLSMHFTHVDGDGRRYRERHVAGKTYRYYADEGRALGSVWTDCPAMLCNTPLRKETTGYPTQKPEKLLGRIVRGASVPGDLVIDPFMGSGTTIVSAVKAARRALGLDVGELSLSTVRARLEREEIAYREAHQAGSTGAAESRTPAPTS
jgi:site-specific DNA-methyltransferase (adenine-specific)